MESDGEVGSSLPGGSVQPAGGIVSILMKGAYHLMVRMSVWCPASQANVCLNGAAIQPLIEASYIKITNLKSGDKVTLAFDVPEKTVHKVIGEIPYRLTIKGSNVVSIDPPGIGYPLYAEPSTKEVERKTVFIPARRNLIW